MASTHFQRKSDRLRNSLAAAEESVESQPGSERAAVHISSLEHAVGARLVPEGSLPTVLGIQTAVACRAASAQMDQLGHALQAGAVQEIRKHAALSLGWNSPL